MGKKEYNMTKTEAVDLLKEWAEELEVDTTTDDFCGKGGVIETLMITVRKEKLTFDPLKRSFKYILFFPIEKEDGSASIPYVDIESTTMERKRVMQGIKDTKKIDLAIAMVAEACGIEEGFAGRLRDKDVTRINAIFAGFLV